MRADDKVALVCIWLSLTLVAVAVYVVVSLTERDQRAGALVCSQHNETFVSVRRGVAFCANSNGIITMRKAQ